MSNVSGGCFPCCAAEEDGFDEEGTALVVPSRDSGRGLPKGIENVFARVANDGKDDEDVVVAAGAVETTASGDDTSEYVGEEMSFNGSEGGDGVRGGGGWPSEVSHAS